MGCSAPWLLGLGACWLAACSQLSAFACGASGPSSDGVASVPAGLANTAACSADAGTCVDGSVQSDLSAASAGQQTASGVVWPSFAPGTDRFLGRPDGLMRDRLIHGRPLRAKKGRGGRSLAFKIDFEDGTQGYFKPAQAFSGTNWYAELAAYHLDRELGMGRVPPVVSRRLPWSLLKPAAGRDKRVSELEIDDRGRVQGALVYWLDGKIGRAKTPPGFENWLRVQRFVRWSVSPFQRPSSYGAALRDNRARARRGELAVRYFDSVPKASRPELGPALSDMLILDFLTLNIDRWGGHNGNVLTLGTPPRLIFLDNAAGFSPGPHTRSLMDARLRPLQRFRRETIEALRSLSLPRLWARLDGEGPTPILNPHLRQGIAVRRTKVLQHVAALQRVHGDQVFEWNRQ